jgi:nitrogen fixation protein FixH
MTATSFAEAKPLSQAEIDRRRGRFVPWVIAAFFLSFMIPLICFTVIAFRHQPSEVTPQAYEKGLAYNQTLEAAAAQKALGWQVTLSHADGRLSVLARDAKGAPLDSGQVEVWLIHPAQKALDRHLVLTPEGQGVYATAAALPSPSVWTAHITVQVADQQMQTRAFVEN